jgi:hypothetical protein
MMVLDQSPGVAGGHISCRNNQRPGWCYWSSDSDVGTYYVGQQEIIAMRLDASQTVERFAHMHNVPVLGYEYESHGVPNRDGSRVMFASGWDGGSVVYSYVAQSY